MSYGGFLGSNQAACFPKAFASLTLLDPAGLAPIKLGPFIFWGMSVIAASMLPSALRTWPGAACGCPRSKTIA